MTTEELKNMRKQICTACSIAAGTYDNTIEKMDEVEPISIALAEFLLERGLDPMTAMTALLHAAGTVSMGIPPSENIN